MSADLVSVPLAFLAGIVGILSPCVWPLVPVVMSSAAANGKAGAAFLALGLSVAFAFAGSLISFFLVSMNLDPELFRYIAGAVLITIGASILIQPLGDWLSGILSKVSMRLPASNPSASLSSASQFGVGALLGLVWLPCIGPTLGAAIALASLGQEIGMAFVIMLAFGLGTGLALLVAGFASERLLKSWKPGLITSGSRGKKLLAWTLLVLGLLVLSGADKILEAFAVGILPEWIYSL